MKLYFNGTTNTFSTTQKDSFDEVFESFDCKRHEKKPVEKTLGIFTVKICRDNWEFSREGFVQWLWVDISVQGKQLLPISMSCRKADTQYHFSEHEIAFQQYGPGHNNGRPSRTYMQTSKDSIDWSDAFNTIAKICNNYSDWIVQETERLLSSLIAHKKYSFLDIATLLSMVRRYEGIVPNIIPVYRDFVDKYCYQAINELTCYIERRHSENKHWDSYDRNSKAICGDILWKYIKDFMLKS